MNWTIIGCGWLGTNLAKVLLQKGNAVLGTTTRAEKLKQLSENGIKSVVFNLNSQISIEIIDFSEIVILSIPPFNRENPSDYGTSLVHLAQQFNYKTRFIFLSSTGIYPEKNGIYSESYIFEKEEQNISLYQAEKQLTDLLQNRLTILRLGGLFGNDRHPIYSISGKTEIKNPKGKINFVGKTDVISVIQLIAQQQIFGEVFNVVFPEHPIRESYYTQKAKALNLIAPTFKNSTSIEREINSSKIQKKLGFIFVEAI